MNQNSSFNIHSKNISMFPRPIPYFNTGSSHYERELAKSLRSLFIPKITKRLPGHHLRGFSHKFIVNYVATHKKQYPYFLRTDIEKFYPSIEYKEMIVNVQLAYKDLLSLQYVPSAFRKKYVPALNQWCNNLPLTRGLPLGSPLSAILAPLMLIPLWLQIKKMFNTPILVFMDDILILAKSQEQLTDIYIYLENSLAENFKLKLNLSKTITGRFASTGLNFCGWEFIREKISRQIAQLIDLNCELLRLVEEVVRS